MTRGILIAGNESTLFNAAAAEAVKRVESFASALIPNRFPLPEGGSVLTPKTEMAGAIPLSWNPSSPISARTLVLAAENRLGKINDAIIVCSPPAVFKSAGNLTPEEIEILVNDHIRGWFFLIRELLLYFRRCEAGSLSLVAPEIPDGGKNAAVDLLGPSALASFRAFAQGVLAQGVLAQSVPVPGIHAQGVSAQGVPASQAGELYQVMGFTTAEAGSEGDFAAWFFKIIDEGSGKNSGRWHKYSKLKFFR